MKFPLDLASFARDVPEKGLEAFDRRDRSDTVIEFSPNQDTSIAFPREWAINIVDDVLDIGAF